MSEKSSLNRTLISLMIFYVFAVLFALLASASILLHVNPYSKCLLYSSHIGGGELSYGNYASKFTNLDQIILITIKLLSIKYASISTNSIYGLNFRLYDGRICVPWSSPRRIISICKNMGGVTQKIRPCSNRVSFVLVLH